MAEVHGQSSVYGKILLFKKAMYFDRFCLVSCGTKYSLLGEKVMEDISFNMSARTAGLIGRDNVPTPYGALIELVKNAYDADASQCIVYVDYLDDCIWIIDDGEGMTSDIIKSSWMIIGTNWKLTNPLSPKKRIKSGAKGIGRFSLDRLGELCEMYTKTQDGELIKWKVNWSDFDQPGVVLTDVKAKLKTGADYTKVEAQLGLPSLFHDHVEKSFLDSGTLFRIQGLRDCWEEKINETRKQLETLQYPKENRAFNTYLIDSNSSMQGKKLKDFKVDVPSYEDYDYSLKAFYEDGTFDIQLTRNETDKSNVTDLFYKLLQKNVYPYNEQGFREDSYKIQRSLEQLLPNLSSEDISYLTSNLGKTSVNLYFVKRAPGVSPEVFRYRYFNITERRDWLASYGGIKIFRDGFKVRPYGEGEAKDWLNLGGRKAQNPAGVLRKGGGRFTEEQLAGAVHISRLDSQKLEDVSSREGFKDDHLLGLLKKVIIALIELIETDRHYAAVALTEEYNKTIGKKAVVTRKEIHQILKNKKISKDEVETLKDAFNQNYKEIENLAGELSLLRALAGIGAVTTSFAHDLRGVQNKILSFSELAKFNLEMLYDEKNITFEESYVQDPMEYILGIDEEQSRVAHWLNYITGTIKRDKRTRKHIALYDYLLDFHGTWKDLLEDKEIELTVGIDQSYQSKIRAFEIDLDSVFSNLVLNSIEAFKKVRNLRKIKITLGERDRFLVVKYSDTGPGLDKKIVDKNKILQFGYSTKQSSEGEDGLGLGMYIVDCILKDNKGDIEIIPSDEGFQVELVWPKVR